MTIHSDHPFQPPEAERSPARRLRSRLPAPVTLWTAAVEGRRTGLTVSSVLVADGDPAYVVGILDPLSDLWEQLQQSRTATVSMLSWRHRQLADRFGYVAPAPGGPFAGEEWRDGEWGPVLASATAWAGCRLPEHGWTELGWGVQVAMRIEHVELLDEADADDAALVHRRGRYLSG